MSRGNLDLPGGTATCPTIVRPGAMARLFRVNRNELRVQEAPYVLHGQI